MTNERFSELISNDLAKLSPEEIAEGWHFCYDWDGLLVGPGTMEQSCCTCSMEKGLIFNELETIQSTLYKM